ncbi:YceD family protein [Sulfurirhabdus autotrophica]|uniref:Large ribosomal RNA subunit accumulation protein YceD n=1 Tax=Sulfurirhabdus autotrophica TaxID=1706046 RepID=A0A4R3YDY8_9PROT|nr:YceD family protein [Sulfurirhabdus autotrophica]TCV90062.1 uncharacterized protein EDC63_10127 [Sulfurirhabdus autotrophica]
MSEQIVIDSLEFARNKQVLHGKITVASLPRLQDVVFSSDGVLEYELSGRMDQYGKLSLHCEVKGTLQLSCQRCLGAFAYPVGVKSDLILIKDEMALAEVDEEEVEDIDVVLADPQLDVLSLIEEEILLDLPMAPVHPIAECNVKDAGQEGSRQGKAFEALAVLKAQNPKK